MKEFLQITGVTIGVVILFFLAYFLRYKKVNVKAILEEIKMLSKKVDDFATAGSNISTGNAKTGFNVAKVVAEYALTAANAAEDKFLNLDNIASDPTGSIRRETATNDIYALLRESGVTITDDVKTIVENEIRNTVFSNKDIQQINEKVDKLIAEKVSALQKQVTDLTSKNTEVNGLVNELKTKIAQTANENNVLNTQISTLTNQNTILNEKIKNINNAVSQTSADNITTGAIDTAKIATVGTISNGQIAK
ncbi:chaperonin cofactor prefoldin [Clostridium acetobutylicum]|uniref:Uncharacterized protein n=1 Tax=Clostridium acetobutylicum (strain ATCC 824 / DSM 792 / JCM 1419 / IAM 19013 / LMG 5710 / NBRC 13948 / NRRL B-527 / VKM B-1787 / 2291 / W) TaxID=272562 RepID=Q97K14_CLOAB|nr:MULTISPECIES: hypothetical protein [Clostridium]AAK79081.1 Hypothetical protein, CF-36 family [Clostridium acetobutylicum ATCC 824]ADZ20156.1 conserved hypothetical protein [Clostridium acetobutylicum EA 2018]AEI31620.1 hypothetical protein SMB_G1125 [Clostridium acetobutylicum DSM 1731]AWV81665.1 hypothetical protein DK921_16520 [Clostridium acetobutylicum]MBC2393310.1 hypothetical protein [Clostridium acetobutylicum]